ncbi:hypothetical protein GCM10010394_63080 [Streptomyces crystallinus]|uniref:Uncharacterized protein n=1 Tax=Streptomyces crystallinus TaxID=68191 RepID=A0ABP3S294_9ACTN
MSVRGAEEHITQAVAVEVGTWHSAGHWLRCRAVCGGVAGEGHAGGQGEGGGEVPRTCEAYARQGAAERFRHGFLPVDDMSVDGWGWELPAEGSESPPQAASCLFRVGRRGQ